MLALQNENENLAQLLLDYGAVGARQKEHGEAMLPMERLHMLGEGNGEEHDDLYNFEPSRSVGELAMEQDRDPG
jgi:hypothetical protein